MPDALCRQCRVRPPSRPGRPYCSKACSNRARKRPLAERLADLCVPGPPDACWVYPGAKDRDGYGVISGDDRRDQFRVHRLAYERLHGPVPTGKQVMHTCDNPPCWNPAHLIAGTALENNRDKAVKGRANGPFGRSWKQLKPDDVVAIRRRRAAGESRGSLAAALSVTKTQIDNIVLRRAWRGVE